MHSVLNETIIIGPSGVRIGPYFAIPFVDAAVKVS